MASPLMDRLTGQLYHLPTIIGRLGISVANAQTQLDADYLENVARLLGLIEGTLGQLPGGADRDRTVSAFESLLETLAPSRYQFTETTIEFRADLAETMDKTVGGSVGFGTGAVTVNAAMTMGYGYDYRASARITAVLQAFPLDVQARKALMERAGEIQGDKLPVPGRTEVEQLVWDSTAAIFTSLTGIEARLPDA